MKQRTPFLLAIDLGTSALKAVVYDPAGQVSASAAREYGYDTPEIGWVEADPAAWWQALCDAVEELHQTGVDLSGVQSVALTGQMHTAVLLDENDQPLKPTILWLDRRAVEETKELVDRFKLPPYYLNSTYTLPKLYWLAKHRPEVVRQVKHLLFPKDYLRFRLTGQIMTDLTEAGGAALLDWDTLTWAEERLDYCGLDPRILPPLQQPTDDGGLLRPEIALQLGLNPSASVLVGAGDVLAILTAAPHQQHRLTCSIGSSSMVYSPIPEDQQLPDGENRIYVYPLLPFRLLGGVSSTTGAALKWAWQSLYEEREDFQGVIESALEIEAGSNDLIFLPFLSGERSPFWNDAIRGSFYGLSLAHTKKHMLHAVMEGVAFSLRYLIDIYTELGFTIDELALAGGGATTPGWPQIIANVCQLPVAIYTGQNTVTSALYAYARQLLAQEDFEQALLRTFQSPLHLSPRADLAQTYNRQYKQYRHLAEFANDQLAEPEE